MLQPTIPFELHLTIGPLNNDLIDSFIDSCTMLDAKPILIELAQGEYLQQPMLTKLIHCKSLSEAQSTAIAYQRMLNKLNFEVRRMKIEIPANHYNATAWETNASFSPYFEWHGKISFERQEELLLLCEKHRVHLSLNALKDAQEVRFVTLREYGTQQQFQTRVDQLIKDLCDQGWPIQKQQAEYCLFDDNVTLDTGWLPN
jgi:hypothetical protein